LVVSERDAFEHGLAIWIRVFAPSVDGVWQAVESLARGGLPPEGAEALHDFAARLSAQERLELAAFPIHDSAPDTPTEEFLEAVRFSEADQFAAASLLVETFAAAETIADRRKVLRCWSALKPVGEANRRKLIEKVLFPLALLGEEGFDLATEFIGLALPAPKGTKRRMGEVFLKEAQASDEQKQRAAEKLKAAGLAKARGFFGKRTEPVDE
jgi:hypothetical protein